LSLNIFDIDIQVRCCDLDSYRLLSEAYSAFLARSRHCDLAITIEKQSDTGYILLPAGQAPIPADNSSELIYYFEKTITLLMQEHRSKWYFIHGAALSYGDKGCLLIAPSGSGKSTTAWALLHHGFHYLSDELAPVDMDTLQVNPYPHAVCLKSSPPPPYQLPAGTLYTEHTIHVPTACLPGSVKRETVTVQAIFFVQYQPDAKTPAITPLSPAEAATRIYTNTLNQLAHANHGLSHAVTLANNARCFQFITGDLETSALALSQTMAAL
jgi:hypothetical protein